MRTNLSSIGEEGRLLVVQNDGFAVQFSSSGEVAGSERLVALVLEVDGFLGHGD